MKKGLKLFLLSSFALAGLVSLTNVPNTGLSTNDIVEEASDLNDKYGVGVRQLSLGTTSEVFVSETKVQLGQIDSIQYLRFVTVVSGPIKSIVYTRATNNEHLGVVEHEVNTVYKAIESAGQVLYYDGTDFVTTKSEETDNYYFACYTIKFETNKYKAEDITAYVTVTPQDETAAPIKSAEKVMSVNTMVENQSDQYIYSAYDIERLNNSIASGVDYSEKSVKLMADIDLGTVTKNVLEVSSDLTFDLNGYSIVANTDTSNLSLINITKGAHLTILDSSAEQDGLVSFKYNFEGSWNPNYTIRLLGYNSGTFTLEGGTIENASGDKVIASAIDNQSGSTTSSKVIINGGNVVCEKQYAIRMFCNSTQGENYVEVNGGTISGRRGIYMQSPNADHNVGLIRINSGIISGTQYKIYVENSTECSIEPCDSKNLKIELNDGIYSYSDIDFDTKDAEDHTEVKVAAKVETTEEFKTALTAGENIVLTEDVALEETNIAVPANEEVTINFKGSELSATSTVAEANALFNVSANATLNLVGEGKIVYDAESPDTSSNPRYASNAISNRGTLLVDGVDIINKSIGSASYCIDNYEGANLTINSGNFINEGKSDAIRVFRYGATFENNIVINGGYFEGRIPLFIQLAGSDAAVAPEVNVTINGGTFVTTDERYYTTVYFLSSGFNYDNVSFTLNGGSFNGYIFVNAGSNSGTMTCEFNGGTFTSGFGVYCYQTYSFLYY